jgi:ArsR family transcriptional regulator
MNEETLFVALADRTRRRIIQLLLEESLCVCELNYALDEPQPKISRHLALLREAKVLEATRVGTWMIYRIHSRLPAWASSLLSAFRAGMRKDAVYARDRRRLRQMPNRPLVRAA